MDAKAELYRRKLAKYTSRLASLQSNTSRVNTTASSLLQSNTSKRPQKGGWAEFSSIDGTFYTNVELTLPRNGIEIHNSSSPIKDRFKQILSSSNGMLYKSWNDKLHKIKDINYLSSIFKGDLDIETTPSTKPNGLQYGYRVVYDPINKKYSISK